jgi:hypothetical protein
MSHGDFIASITPDVLRSLRRTGFFLKLDNLFSPDSGSVEPARCDKSFAQTIALLRSLDFDGDEVGDILTVLTHYGACCDCEVLYNVAEHSRLKANHWRQIAESLKNDRDSLSDAV